MERQIQDTFTRFTGNNEVEKLIDFNKNQGKFDYKVNSNIQNQDSSRLGVKSIVPQKEMPKPPSNNKKVPRSDFETKLFNSRSAAKVLQQNWQMFKASKTVWDTNITNIRNVFAYLTVWLNPIQIEAKLGRYTHSLTAGWVLYIWDTMMPRALNKLIIQKDIRSNRVANQREHRLKQSTQVCGSC